MVLMNSDVPQVEILFTDDFKSRLRTLTKRYRSIRADLQVLLDEIQSGNYPGDRMTNIGSTVFKVRLKNSDIDKGKSGGYRVIYQLMENLQDDLFACCWGGVFLPPPQQHPFRFTEYGLFLHLFVDQLP
jgi:mRNA-degrading endonuclease RelE of RelBE toxin-antitoxin system